MSRLNGFGQRLYKGEISYDFISHRKIWYVVSIVLVVASIAAIAIRGLNLGIEFRGGADFAIPNATCSVAEARELVEAETGGQAIVTQSGSGIVRVQTETLTSEESIAVAAQLAAVCGVPSEDITVQVVGPTWGAEISVKALQGLAVFLVLLAIFLSIYFEWRMAVGALVALVHDLIITIGIYAAFGLKVTPATAIGLLTILSFSLYDTVVVYDKVKENARGITGQSVMTYDEAANLAINQTVVRSINTSITSLLPVLAIIIVGAGLLGAGTLLDLSIALAVGMAVGAYSSIFIATPLLVEMKDRQPEMRALAARVNARRKQAAKGTSTRKAANAEGEGEPGDSPAPVSGNASPEQLRELARSYSSERVQPKRQPRRKRR